MSTIPWSGRKSGLGAGAGADVGAGQEPGGDSRLIYGALAAARSEFQRAAKDRSNPHLKNRYATLASVMEACDAALGRHGLSFSQPIVQTPTGPVLRTILVHLESGERIESDCPLLYDSASKLNPMQALGSAITYARRYGLESLLGLIREDDDAEAAFARHRERPEPASRARIARPADNNRDVRPVSRAAATAPAAPVTAPGLATSRDAAPGSAPPQPFGVWVRAAAEQLGLGDPELVDRLHDAAVQSGQMVAVEPSLRAQALARRYNDRLKGRTWRDWMRAQCKAYQAQRQPAPASAGVMVATPVG